MTHPSVSVTIAQWGKTDLTVRAVNAIRRSDYEGPIEILVYDNASPGGPGLIADRDDVTLVQGDDNIGFGPAHNALAGRAHGDLLLILNNDTVVSPSAIRMMAECLLASGNVGAVTPQYRDFEGSTLEMGGYVGAGGDGWQLFRKMRPPYSLRRMRYPSMYGSAACLLVRRSEFLRRGGFDDIYAPAYYEDTDLCFQLAADGLEILVEPKAVVYHYEGATAGTDVTAGLKRFQVVNRTTFVRRWNDRLSTLPAVGFDTAVRHAITPGSGRRVLWAAPHLPRPDREAGHARLLSMLDALKAGGEQVVLWAEHLHDARRYAPLLEERGIPWFGWARPSRWPLSWSRPSLSSITELLETIDWDTVIVSFPELAERVIPLVRQHRPSAAVLVDNVDLHFLRLERGAEIGQIVDGELLKAKEREVAAYRASDGVITASDVEAEILAAEIPGLPLYPYISVAASDTARQDGPDPKGSLLFLGNFVHPPNRDAVEWWIEVLAPLVEAKAGRRIPLTVVGAGSEMYAEEWTRRGPVNVIGWVEDLSDVFEQTRLFFAPLRYGAGTKGKLLTAVHHGVPILTTPVGAEGNAPDLLEAMQVEESPEDLARAAVRLMTDDEAWSELVSAADGANQAMVRSQRAMQEEFVAWVRRRTIAR